MTPLLPIRETLRDLGRQVLADAYYLRQSENGEPKYLDPGTTLNTFEIVQELYKHGWLEHRQPDSTVGYRLSEGAAAMGG